MLTTLPTSFKRKKWTLPALDPAAVVRLAHEIGCPDLVARLLLTRGIASAGAAAAFLNPAFKDMVSPALLPNIDLAADRIAAAVRDKQKIILYGDYDVDGITGTTMLWHTLKAAGADVHTYIPHRVEEGYGLNTEAVIQLINEGAQLIVTIDCGISGHAPIAAARERGIDVVVSDHHEIPPTLPAATAIVHPRLPGSKYPNPDLCGAGVAFKLAWRVAQKICNAERVTDVYKNLLVEFAALVALGTVADVVPLTGENRILVRYGLLQAARTGIEGLKALIDAAGFSEKKVDAMAVGFSLGPRLNAAGRMGHAREAVELLTTARGPRCSEIATWLEARNRERQATERDIFAKSQKQIAASLATGAPLPHVIVVHDASFHAGVVGIVASRIVERWHRPTFVLATSGGEAHGSARSIDGFELHEAIEHCRDLLLSGGGHAMAGGVKLPAENLPAFIERLNDYAREVLTEEQLQPILEVDAEVQLRDCDIDSVAVLEKFEPFGRGNERPALAIRRVKISAPPRRVGATGSHLQLQVSDGKNTVRGIAFGMGEIAPQLPVGMEIDLVVEPRIDRYFENRPRVDLMIADIARTDGEPLSK